MSVYECSGCYADYCNSPHVKIHNDCFCSDECVLKFYEKLIREKDLNLPRNFIPIFVMWLPNKEKLLKCNVCGNRFVDKECQLFSKDKQATIFYCPHCERILEVIDSSYDI